MNKENILAGREVIEKYLADRNLIDKEKTKDEIVEEKHEYQNLAEAALIKLGFKGFDDFYDQNTALNYSEIKRCYKGSGTCDLCKDRKFGCLSVMAGSHLIDKYNKEDNVFVDNTWSIPWIGFYLYNVFPQHLPPGCSFTLEKIHEPEFDVYWNMPKSFTQKYIDLSRAKFEAEKTK
ncbi:MAG: hypothetical protein K8S18_04960 [Desulfobacula sp.]|nr:hypothetical protein [Desulfobacula sp.]